MTGQELYQLGKGSPAAEACVPMNFEHTLPRLIWEEGWVAEFWYYTGNASDQALYEPQYYLALELPGGHPVRMRRLQRSAACMGAAPELIQPAFYTTQNGYLSACEDLMSGEAPSAQQLEALRARWLEAQPALLAQWFRAHEEDAAVPVERPASPQRAGQAAAPESLADYWKQAMAKAIQAGDSEGAKRAQLELTKAARQSR